MNNEKLQALAQHLGIEFFEYNDNLYIGLSQEEFEEMETSLEEDETKDRSEIDEILERYIEDNATLLEDEFKEVSYDDNRIEYGDQEYLVVTNEEADELWDESLENYIEQCILPEIPKSYQSYFDNEKLKSDAKMDGRGDILSGYDGNESEETVEGTTYYIYRTN